MTILYEDNHLIAVVKPPNLLTQSDCTGDPNLLDQVKAYIKARDHKPGNVYVGMVHRLDRPVGGVLLFAKTSKAAARLCKLIAGDQAGREYLAVVGGQAQGQARLTNYLLKDTRINQVSAYDHPVEGAKEAVLDYRQLAQKNGLALLTVRLHTGRSHQIRVQLSHAGLPIYGDVKYGSGEKTGIALWCCRMTIIHPVKKVPMTFTSYPSYYPFSIFDEVKKSEA